MSEPPSELVKIALTPEQRETIEKWAPRVSESHCGQLAPPPEGKRPKVKS